jgi:hypothetical protein
METAGAMAGGQQTKQRSRAGRFAPGVSGNPRGAALDRVADRAAELFQIMASEFGALSPCDQVMLRQACLLLARSERLTGARNADASVRMASEARRTLASLRKGHEVREPAPETFAEVAKRAQAEASARRAAELAADEAGDTAHAPAEVEAGTAA